MYSKKLVLCLAFTAFIPAYSTEKKVKNFTSKEYLNLIGAESLYGTLGGEKPSVTEADPVEIARMNSEIKDTLNRIQWCLKEKRAASLDCSLEAKKLLKFHISSKAYAIAAEIERTEDTLNSSIATEYFMPQEFLALVSPEALYEEVHKKTGFKNATHLEISQMSVKINNKANDIKRCLQKNRQSDAACIITAQVLRSLSSGKPNAVKIKALEVAKKIDAIEDSMDILIKDDK